MEKKVTPPPKKKLKATEGAKKIFLKLCLYQFPSPNLFFSFIILISLLPQRMFPFVSFRFFLTNIYYNFLYSVLIISINDFIYFSLNYYFFFLEWRGSNEKKKEVHFGSIK